MAIDINGIAHVQLTVSDPARAVPSGRSSATSSA